MSQRIAVQRFSDRRFSECFERSDKPFVLLFESRYDANAGKMILALQSVLERYGSEITGGICMVEDSPKLSWRFDIRGVPTVIAGQGDTVLGESLGLQTEENLNLLIDKWLSEVEDEDGFGEENQSIEEEVTT